MKMMNNIKGRHWVFIVGFIGMAITSIWSVEAAKEMAQLLFFIGIGIAFFR
jgi:hypothetical protein